MPEQVKPTEQAPDPQAEVQAVLEPAPPVEFEVQAEAVLYANVAQVLLTVEEACIILGVRDPRNPARASSAVRVYMTLPHLKRLAMVIAGQIAAYEAVVGEIPADPLSRAGEGRRRGRCEEGAAITGSRANSEATLGGPAVGKAMSVKTGNLGFVIPPQTTPSPSPLLEFGTWFGQALGPDFVQDQMLFASEYLRRSQILVYYVETSTQTGGYVKFIPQHACLPLLEGNGRAPVYLYEFVEVIDGLLDYDLIHQELPQLRYEQIGGAMDFLRRVCQFNISGADVDAIEERLFVDENAVRREIIAALNDQEPVRVLDNVQP